MIDGQTLMIRFDRPGCSFLFTIQGKLSFNPCGKKDAKFYVQKKNASGQKDEKIFSLCEEHLIDPQKMTEHFRDFDEKEDAQLKMGGLE